jgi:hypothetical protein
MSDPGDLQASRVMYYHLRAALARAGIQAYLVLNGAAAIALLAFLGDLSTRGDTESRLVADLGLVKFALIAFALGVALSAGTYGIAFLVHNNHIAGRHRAADLFRSTGVFMNVAALLLFVAGVVITSRAITPR